MPLTLAPTSSSVLDMVPMNEEMAAKLEAAGRHVAEQKESYDAARAHREDAIREAALTGATYREIARVSGVSYQRVAQLLTGEPPYAYPFDVDMLIHCPKCKAKPRESCKSKGSFHLERHARFMQIIEGEVKPRKGELRPMMPFYCRMHLALGQFPQSRGDLSTDPNDIVLGPGEFLGQWTGRKWERV